MNDDRTPKEKYAAWVKMVNITHSKGWVHIDGSVFCSPSGTNHDLSCANLERLDHIEKDNLFRV